MRKGVIILSIFLLSLGVSAHQPDISTTVLAEQPDGRWIVQIRASLTALEQEISMCYPDSTFKTPQEFEQLVLNHLKRNIYLCTDQKDTLLLSNAQILLGHETNIVFEISDVAKNFHYLTVQNTSFKEIHRNQNALVLLKDGFEQAHFILNDDNQQRVQLETKGNQFVLLHNTKAGFSLAGVSPLVILVLFLALGSVFYFGINAQKKMRVAYP